MFLSLNSICDFINFCIEKLCHFQSLHVRDIVRDSLEKDPVDRAPEDIEILLEFTQKLEAFNHMTMAVRRALCSGKNRPLVSGAHMSAALNFMSAT